MGAGPILSASPELQKAGYKVSGVVVIDVVEGKFMWTLDLGVLIANKVRDRCRSPSFDEEYPRPTTQVLQISHRCYPLAVGLSSPHVIRELY